LGRLSDIKGLRAKNLGKRVYGSHVWFCSVALQGARRDEKVAQILLFRKRLLARKWVHSLPPCGGGLGRGGRANLSEHGAIISDRSARPPSPALPHKGGGGAHQLASAHRAGGHAAETPSSLGECEAFVRATRLRRYGAFGVTASRRRGLLPTCPFGARCGPLAAIAHQKDMVAKRHRRAELSGFAELLRRDRRRRLDLDSEHGDGSATPKDTKPHASDTALSLNRRFPARSQRKCAEKSSPKHDFLPVLRTDRPVPL